MRFDVILYISLFVVNLLFTFIRTIPFRTKLLNKEEFITTLAFSGWFWIYCNFNPF